MIEHKKRAPASVGFSHLTDEERIDKACEILAMGVLRLAEKRNLLNQKKKEEIRKDEKVKIHALPENESLKTETPKPEAVL